MDGKRKLIYKIVRKTTNYDWYASAFVPDGNKYCVLYSTKRFTYPSLGFLYGFGDLRSALSLARPGSFLNQDDLYVFRATAEVVYQPTIIASSVSEESIERVWKNNTEESNIALGSVMCKWISLDSCVAIAHHGAVYKLYENLF